ncbi:hypothetical protein scyTo_0024131 [Scyliorhinus torazame]|uniref:Uncharacterized protein n=1 Tax=Scyliorhinus torazame TaxID=75743 RepID=A0A401QDR2_SCYTO|nr:hypothetical protein [Scyliorhinus torazame]
MSHKRAASADTKQLNFASAGNLRKDPLSLFGGLKTKSDPMSQSNLCINGSHVYTEEPSQAAAAAKPRTDPRPLYSSHFFPSAEDLSGRFSPDALEPGGPLSPSRTSPGTSPGEQAPKPAAPPENRASGSASDLPDPQRADRVKEGTDSRQGGAPGAGKRGMDQKAETNSASATGGRSLNPFDNDEDKMAAHPGSKAEVSKVEVSKAEVSKAEQTPKKEETKRGGLMSFFPRKTEAAKGPEAKEPRNPFDAHGEEAKRPPGTSVWSSRTAAIKPK